MASPATACRVAKAVVRHARVFKVPDFGCFNCGQLPLLPVVGTCGHTRCLVCFKKSRKCPCGSSGPKVCSLNLKIRNILRQLVEKTSPLPVAPDLPNLENESASPEIMASLLNSSSKLKHRKCNVRNCRCYSQKERMEHAMALMKLGEYQEAVPHLAHAAATSIPSQTSERRRAFNLLLKCVTEILNKSQQNEQTLIREINRSVRAKCKDPLPNVELSDLECPICLEYMNEPVTMPCGHTFCRLCISKAVKKTKRCAYCRYSLRDVQIKKIKITQFVAEAIKVANIPAEADVDTECLPIFCCTAAFPTIPCPLLIMDPCNRNTMQRLIDSGTRRFGMVATNRDGSVATIGTMVEVRDCVQLQDGCTILSTVGITRITNFQAAQRNSEEELDFARVTAVKDITPKENEYADLHVLARSITDKAIKWLATLSTPVLTNIENAFGPMPLYTNEHRWWTNPDCPKWLWWIIAVLPYSSELQVLMLLTKHLKKRMLAVSRTLDLIKNIGVLFPNVCTVRKA